MGTTEHIADSCDNALSAGNTVGRYRIERVIGRGSFGFTYEVWDKRRRKKAALKEYFPTYCASRLAGKCEVGVKSVAAEDYVFGKECFLDEASKLKNSAQEKHIVHVYDVFEQNGTAYFAMEYVEGVSLYEYVRTHGGRLSYEETEALFSPIMEDLAAIHSAGIIHGDVNPENIIITSEGRPVLVDFGYARYLMGSRSRMLRKTLYEGFAPKELYLRDGKPDIQSDEYGVAAAMYYTLTGEIPASYLGYPEGDIRQLPSRKGAALTVRQDEAIARALSVKKTDRYSDVSGLKTALGLEQKKEEITRPDAGKKVRTMLKRAFAEKTRLIKLLCTMIQWILTLGCFFILILFSLAALLGAGYYEWGQVLFVTIPCAIVGLLLCPKFAKIFERNRWFSRLKIPVIAAALAFMFAGAEWLDDADISNGDIFVYQDSFEFSISDGEVKITEYIGTETQVEVPESIEGYTVTKIGNLAFAYCRDITQIILPDSITQIRAYAFRDCSSLIEINIPSSVNYIGEGAFVECVNLTSVDVPESVASIYQYTFYECRKLETANLPDGLISIEKCAFESCAALTNLSIPDSVQSIGKDAFDGCRSLTEVYIPDNVESLPEGVFDNCENLTVVSVPADCMIYDVDSGYFACDAEVIYRQEESE